MLKLVCPLDMDTSNIELVAVKFELKIDKVLNRTAEVGEILQFST